MSDKNSQIKIHLIESIKDQSDTKTSIEKLNNLLQELHKNIMKDSNMIKSSNKDDKNKIGGENPNENSDFIQTIKKESKEENDEQVKEKIADDNMRDNNNDKASNKNLINIKISGEDKSTSDINLMNKINFDDNININNINEQNEININNLKEKDTNEIGEVEINKKEEDIEKKENIYNEKKGEETEKKENYLIEKTNEKTKEKTEEENNNKIDNNNTEEDKYTISNLTVSSIGQNNINSFNMTKGSELYLNNIIDNIGGKESEKESKKESEELTESVKTEEPNEEIHLALTNIQPGNDEGNPSMITNELNKAYIRTNDYTKSKEIISNIDSDGVPKEEEKTEKSELEKIQPKKKNSKTNNINNNTYDKSDIFKPQPKKDQNELIKENREEIENEINKMYELKLNLVKINNKEKFSYITKYNDLDKDKFGYEPDYFFVNKNSLNFLNRRNKFIEHKYFSYILSKDGGTNNNSKDKDKKKKIKEKNKEDLDINDNFVYIKEEVNKFKKNYNEKIEPLKMSLNYIRANTNNSVSKEYRIYDIEDMTSFYYYFKLYTPEEKFINNLEINTENEILKNFTSYRKVLNDGNSFKRAFSYSLLECFLLKNNTKKLNYLIYDINRMLQKKYNNEIKQICNLLIDIKENSSIEYLMNSYNNPSINFDEILINYIDLNIRKVLGIENNKRKYLEIDYNIMKILVNIFDVNIEIYYIEEEENMLKMGEKLIYNDTFYNTKKNLRRSSYSDYDCSTTFRFLFFLNSYYIIYTDKSDMDSTMANNNNQKQYYYIDNLPTYKCPNCKENTGLDIIPSSEAIFCHICLNKYLKDILERRVILFLKSNFSCIEYYTRPIKITSDIVINFSLYKYITKNYIISDFEKILEKSCFRCFKIFHEKNKIKKLKCLCQVCDICFEKMYKENLKDKIYLNKYEIHNMPRNKCLCGNDIDLQNFLKLSKNKPSDKDKKLAEDRLKNILKKKCCLCLQTNEQKLFDFQIMEGPNHFMCINCYEKEQKKETNDKDENDKDSNDNIINNKNKKLVIKRKIACKICYEEHIWIEDDDIIDKKKLISKTEVKLKCCKDKCYIF